MSPRGLRQHRAEHRALNVSHFGARTIWLRCDVSPVRLRANCLQRREPQPGLLVPLYTDFDLRQTPIN
jgi:hypothetical protein